MALILEKKLSENPVHYDRFSGKVTVQRRLHSTSNPEMAIHELRDSVFENIAGIPSPDIIIVPTAQGTELVYLWPVEYHLTHPNKTDYSDITVTFEGHVRGAMRWEPDIGTVGRLQLWGRKELEEEGEPPTVPPTVYKYRPGLGPNGAGLPIQFPQVIIRVVYNVPRVGIGEPATTIPPDVYSGLCASLAGSINEDFWRPKVFMPSDKDWWPQGEWLYLGAQPDVQRDGTYVFTHKFIRDMTGNAHAAAWREGRSERTDEAIWIGKKQEWRVIRKYQADADRETQQAYAIAGTDTDGPPPADAIFFGNDEMYKFAHLGI